MALPVFNVRIIEPLEITPSDAPKKGIEKQTTSTPLIKRRMMNEPTKPPDRLLGDGVSDWRGNSSAWRGNSSHNHEVREAEADHPHKEGIPSVNEGDGIGAGQKGQTETLTGRRQPEPSKFLFDKETIERIAKAPSTDNRSLTFDAPEFRHRGYMRMLKQRIESIWVYPRDAIRQGISGDLYIRFSINRDGSLGEVELVRTSGYRSLDESAMKAIRDAQPFWPLPDDWQRDDLVINGHFIYILGEAVIM
ncbi:MAG: hypothetical protein Fur0020_04530 [Thermodesulfovibrionia bacterium]